MSDTLEGTQIGSAGTGGAGGVKTPPKLTEYVVLTETGDKGWKKVDTLRARSAKAAVAEYVTAANLDSGTFVAIPARSFDPITVKTETKTKLSFS